MSHSEAALLGFDQPQLAHLHRASRPDIPEGLFERDFVARLSHILDGAGIAIWFDPGGETLYLRHRRDIPGEELQNDTEGWKQHGRLLKQCTRGERVNLFPPGWTSGEAGNPTSRDVIIAAAVVHQRQWALLEVFYRPGAAANRNLEEDKTLLRLAAEFAADRIRSQQMHMMQKTQADWKNLDRYAHRVHGSLEVEKTAYLIANEAASFLGCDRVTIAVRERKRAIVKAVSGQAVVQRRANLVRLQERLGSELLDSPSAIIIGPRVRQVEAAQVESVDAYLAESGAKTLFAIPMRMKAGEPSEGVMFVEQFDERVTADTISERIPHVVSHATAALQNSRQHGHLFLADTRTKIGRALQESTKIRSLIIYSILAIIGLSLYFIPMQLRMEGSGALRAEVRRGVFAPESGVVRQVAIEHGDKVAGGQLLAIIDNPELSVARQQAHEELISAGENLKLKEAERANRPVPQRAVQLDGEIAEHKERVTYLRGRIELLDKRLGRLHLTAPIDGIVASWDPKRQLQDRPVTAGTLLLNVVDETSPWRIELRLPEIDAGPVLEAWGKRPAGSEGLPVEYLLATYPDRRYQGTLVDVSLVTEIAAEAPTINLIIKPSPDDPPPLRDGAEVRGKISCGERSLGYIVFRELIEFVHSRVLFFF